MIALGRELPLITFPSAWWSGYAARETTTSHRHLYCLVADQLIVNQGEEAEPLSAHVLLTAKFSNSTEVKFIVGLVIEISSVRWLYHFLVIEVAMNTLSPRHK